MLRELKNLTAVLILSFLLVNLSCSDDCPTCPDDPEIGSYYVYMAGDRFEEQNYIWIADSKTDSIIDSIIVPNSDISMMDITLNGDYLAVLMPDLDTVYVIDTETKEILAGLHDGLPEFSYDDAYLIIADIHSDSLFKYSTLNWELIGGYDFRDDLQKGSLFNTSHIFFCLNNNDEYIIFDYETGTTVKKDTLSILASGSAMWIVDMIASPDDQYIYWLGVPNHIFKTDYLTDSVVDSIGIVYGAWKGELKNGRHGNYLFLTESTDFVNMMDDKIGNLLIINHADFRDYKRIPTWNLNPAFPGAPIDPLYFDMTPDGFQVISGTKSYGPAVSFNLLNHTASFVKGFANEIYIYDVAIGKQIE